jgi:MFS superfamily sulfate permease-like transporter
VVVAGLQAPLSFLNASSFRADVQHMLQVEPAPRLLVLEASGMLEIDFTAAQELRDLFRELRTQSVTVAVARLESLRAQDAFERFGLFDVLPRDRVFRSVEEAVRALAP